MKTFILILTTAVLSITATFFLTRKPPAPSVEKQPLYYQSAMHPWIKSDKPGRCTICGMELTPVYAGDQGFDNSAAENSITLTQSQSRILGVATSKIASGTLTRTLQVAGMIDDDDSRHRILSAYVPGRVDKLHVNYVGAEVTEGQPLADIYSPALLQAEREYRQLTGDLKRTAALRLKQMGLTPEQITALADKPADQLTTTLLAPMTGTVVARDVYEGQYLAEGGKLFEIADFSTMWFKFDAYEQDLPWLKTGQPVSVQTSSLPGKTFEGKITFIDPNLSEATRSTKVRVDLPNPLVNGRRELFHRTYADATILIEQPNVLLAPKAAVVQTGSEAVVYVDLGHSNFAQRVVTLGRRGDKEVEILSGVNAGDSVVTTGTLLIDGQAEMNRSFSAPETGPRLTDEQKTAIRDFVETADAMSLALANSNLAEFNQVGQAADKKSSALVKELAVKTDLEEKSHFHGYEDIKKAREAFYHFSMTASELLGHYSGQPGVPDFQIWKCPMVDAAIKIPTKHGLWIQKTGRAGMNPYFGSEMLDCGEPVKGGASHD